MAQAMVIQGRNISDGEIALIRDLMARRRDWGRTRNDRDHRIQAPVKDMYLYPLIPDFRQELCAPACSRTEGRAGR